MSKKKVTSSTKVKYAVNPFPEGSTVDEICNVDGINLPQTTASILKRYYDAFLSQGFSTEQSFNLTLQFVKFYLGTSV